LPKFQTRQKDEFILRCSAQLDKIGVPEIRKKCLLELLKIELEHPTTEDDFDYRYRQIIESSMHVKGR
jgi:hypothetical protein